MKKRYFLLAILLFGLFLSACSSNELAEDSVSSGSSKREQSVASEDAVRPDDYRNTAGDFDDNASATNKETQQLSSKTNMVIYTAQLDLEVKDIKKVNEELEKKVKELSGYIVEANIYQGNDNGYTSTLTVRVPQKNFEGFLAAAEKLAVKVQQRNVSGSDVSEEYVDLESRLKSKQAVEKRLLEFMQKAETTKDLLDISSDLAAVQEQIEQIEGKMKYLDQQVAYSTVTINLTEKRIKVPELEQEELNTWERTKSQFLTSINFLLKVSSAAVVFLIGNLPIFIIIAVGISAVFIVIKRRKEKSVPNSKE